jgi:hypothetical protein
MRETLFSMLSLIVVSCVIGISGLGFVLIHRGRDAMEKSDAAFHSGHLRESAKWAKAAALSYVPSAQHVKLAEQRLSAIARGAEGTGDWDLARRAWDALRVCDEQTRYPGRGVSPAGEQARGALSRLWARAAQEQGTSEIR